MVVTLPRLQSHPASHYIAQYGFQELSRAFTTESIQDSGDLDHVYRHACGTNAILCFRLAVIFLRYTMTGETTPQF